MTAEFTNVLKGVEPTLRAHGFKRVRNRFYLARGGNIGMIEFQKSMKSGHGQVVFTVNVGVQLNRISHFRGGTSDVLPEADDCHWRERIGFLLAENQDKWWTLATASDVGSLTAEIRDAIVTNALPHLLTYLDDEALRDLWLSGRSPGLTQTQRLLNLSVLLKEIGPVHRLPGIILELRHESEGKPSEAMVERHIKKLNSDKLTESGSAAVR